MTVDPFDHIPDACDIDAAAARIAGLAVQTPVLRSEQLDALTGAQLWFKCENLQRGGAFKFRGACNAVYALSEAEAERGVVTQSSGNHGAALALACRLRGIEATVVVPRSAPTIKREAILRAGARIIDCEVSQAARDAATREVLDQTGASYIHPFNDARVIAGQATAARELLHEQPGLEQIMAPVSGGGLLSGTAISAHLLRHEIAVFGAEPAGAADAEASLRLGERQTGRPVDTICDGLRAELGPLTFRILREHRAQILLADDTQVIHAMRLIFDQLKLVVEPSAAVTLAVILAHPAAFRGRSLGVILSGGNLDLDHLPWQR